MGLSSELESINTRRVVKSNAKFGYWAEDFVQLPEARWHVKKHVREGQTCVIYGRPQAFKTFFVLDMALSVATGENFLRNDDYAVTKPGKVVYILAEGSGNFRRRIQAWAVHRNCPIPAESFLILPQAYNLNDEGVCDDIVRQYAVLSDETPVLFVVDTLSQCLDGDENNSSSMRNFVNNIARLKRAWGGATAIINHHCPKAEESTTYRGSGALEGNTDAMFFLHRESIDSGHATVECVKMKEGRALPAYTFQATEYALGIDSDGEEITSLAVDMGDESPKHKIGKKAAEPTTAEKVKTICEALKPELTELTSKAAKARLIRARWNEHFEGTVGESTIRQYV